MSKVDDGFSEYFESGGTWGFEPRTSDLERVYKGQNRLLEKVAAAVDAAFPPEEYGHGHGTGHTPPGDIVRQFMVKLNDEPNGT